MPKLLDQVAKRWLHRAGLLRSIRRFRAVYRVRRLLHRQGLRLEKRKDGKIDVTDGTRVLRLRNQDYDLSIVASDFEYWFAQVLPDVTGQNQVVDYSEPKQHALMQTRIPFWFTSIADGEIPVAGYICDYLPKPGDIVFDCGAYCGVASYFFSRLVGPSGRVFAFEPDHRNASLLERNMEEHGIKNVEIIRRGIWSNTTQIQFENRADIGSGFLRDPYRPGLTVKTFSIPDACSELGIAHPNLVKMDIEGAEIEAVEGCLSFLKGKDIRFAIASYHIRNGCPTSNRLEALFRTAGYDARSGYPPHRTTWAQMK